MSSFKPGVLCWIKAGESPQNVGKIVELVEFLGEAYLMKGEDWWHTVSKSPLITNWPQKNKMAAPGAAVGIRQIYLVPINDPDLDVGEVENDSIPAPIYANIKAHT